LGRYQSTKGQDKNILKQSVGKSLKNSSVPNGRNAKWNTGTLVKPKKTPLCSMFQKSIYKEKFKIQLERLGYSKGSLNMLPACVAEFLQQLEAKGIYRIRDIEPQHIQEHYEYLTQRPNKRKPGGLSSVMINHHIYAIRLFLNFLEQTGEITENPISGLIFPRPESKPREILTIKEIKQLYELSETFREKAIIGIFYGCGLRRSEGEALNIKDVSFKSSLLYVREGKGRKRRVVPINEKVMDDFKNYLYHERSPTDKETAFICNNAGRRMRGDKLNNTVKELILKAGIQKEISLHNLRHSIATHLLDNGLSVEYVRDFLGHKHLESTQLYTRVKNKQIWNLKNI
jgi:integrase/recombinase XerD